MTSPATTGGLDDDGQDDNASPPDPSNPDDGDDEPPADSTGGAGSADCCEPHRGSGCDDETIEACVCEEDAVCCTFDWDELCVNTARNRCGACGGAGIGDSGSTTEAPLGSSGSDAGSSGDTDAMTTSPTSSAGTTDDPSAGGEACCEPTGSPGCATDKALEMCVCGQDAYCCENEWDGICVNQAVEDCGAQCVFGEGCCEVHPLPGCDDDTVETCVCMADPFCCEENWDQLCVDEVESEMCGSC